MSDPATPTGGPEHDAWLREALRHAPDASAAPPLSLREAIFAEARAATKPRPRATHAPKLADRFAEIWSWLGRPPVAAGFASVMAATLVGLMWWDRPLDEMAPPAPAPAATTRAPAPEAARPTPAPAAPPPLVDQTTATPPATQAAPPNAPAEALRSPPNARPATAERAATADRAERERRGFAAAPRALPPAPVAATPDKAKTATDALGAGRKDEDLRRSNAAPGTAAAPAAPAAIAAPAATAATAAPNVSAPPLPFPARDAREPETQARAPTQTPVRPQPTELAKKAGKAEKNDADEKRQAEVAQSKLPSAAPATAGVAAAGAIAPPTGASTDGGVAADRFAPAPRPAPLARQRAAESASTTARPMASLLAALSNDGARWSRPALTGETIAADAATRAWLARIDAAATQWQPVSERPSRLDAASASPADASTLLLYREGRVAALVRIDDAGAYFESRPGPGWFAPLAPDVVARLRATLPAATR